MLLDPRAVSKRRPVIICSQSITQDNSHLYHRELLALSMIQEAGEPMMIFLFFLAKAESADTNFYTVCKQYVSQHLVQIQYLVLI